MLLGAGLLALPGVSARAQSLYGPGGLFLHPAAVLPPEGQLTVGGLILTQRIPSTPGLHETPTWGSVSLDYGVTRDVEAGITSLAITDFEPSYGGFAKYRFLHETPSRPAAAVGFSILGFGDNNTRTGFLALRKQLNSGASHPIIGHLGVQYIDILAGIPYKQWLPHVGVELGLTQRLTLIAEARPRGKGDLKTASALSLSYGYGHGGRVVLSWVNTGQSTQSRFGFGVGYAIGGRR